ncbi:MAG TPA: Ldh family oxidoreductase [Gaiellaceae bacterium]|nr:Ldh family oxidoreductase [Gaiellaceae bacterium]
MTPDEGLRRLHALGFAPADARELWEHFDDAERRGKASHGHSRIAWLETQTGFDPLATHAVREESDAFWRWDGDGAIGYLTVQAAVRRTIERPPREARLVVLERSFPSGMLGRYARLLAAGGLVSVLTATSPRRLGHPEGGPKLAGTNPLAIGIPSSGGDPVVADVSMGAVTWGDVVAGLASEEQLVPFGGERAHKAFALAVGLQLLVDALVREPGHGVVLLVARPASDPVPALRRLAAGVRLPGDA